jgi:hypothetical protein
MKLRCPVCHCTFSLEAIVASDAGRDLLIALAEQGPLFRPLVQYLGLFRTAQRDLSYTKALKLVNEVVALGIEPDRLAIALQDTVEAIHTKRQQGTAKPFKNHNYLLSVLDTVSVDQPQRVVMEKGRRPGKSKGTQAIIALEEWAGDDWLKLEIGAGLARLIVLRRSGAPASDTIAYTASEFERFLVKKNQTIRDIDQPRIREGFEQLVNSFDGWPEPKDLFANMPRRPDRKNLPEGLSDDDRAAGAAFFKDMSEGNYGKSTGNHE